MNQGKIVVRYAKALFDLSVEKKVLEKGTEVRRAARNSGLVPGSTQVIPNKRKQPPKHKKDLLEI